MKKAIVYSRHAETVIQQRSLEKRWVEAAVQNPEWITADPSGDGSERRYLIIPERDGRILRVVCAELDDKIRIISAFFDRDARRP